MDNFFAGDTIDALLLQQDIKAGKIAVLDDINGVLTRSLATNAQELQVFCGSAIASKKIQERHLVSSPEKALDQAQTVLLRMPKSLSKLEEYAQLISNYSLPDVKVICVGKDKHMNKSFNTLLAQYFDNVTASLGWKKCRAITAEHVVEQPPIAGNHRAFIQELALEVSAHGGVFAGNKYDIGTRAFIEAIKGHDITGKVADLGCGNGLISAFLLKNYPALDLEASDDSYFAYLSTQETLQANKLHGKVFHSPSLEYAEDSSFDHIFLNPPFHSGPRVDPSFGQELIQAAAKKLKSGGHLWCVYNSALHKYYMPEFKIFAQDIIHLHQTSKFIVKQITKA